MSQGHTNWLLCGGIGSGKSVVRGLLEERGIDTIDADSVGHEVLAPGGAAESEVAATWPSVVVGGAVDRAALGRIVFADPAELRRLEGITHPHIFAAIGEMVRERAGTVVVEVPLLGQPFEPAWPRIVVDATTDEQVERAVRRGMGRDEVLRRMQSQPTRAVWLASADLVIPNHDDLAALEAAVDLIVPVLTAPVT